MQAFITNGIASLLVSADGDPWIPLTFPFRDLHGPLTTRLLCLLRSSLSHRPGIYLDRDHRYFAAPCVHQHARAGTGGKQQWKRAIAPLSNIFLRKKIRSNLVEQTGQSLRVLKTFPKPFSPR